MNNATSLNLEFIQKTTFARLSNVMINVYDFHIITYFRYTLIMQNKANFPHFSPKNDDLRKNKPNSKPISEDKNGSSCVENEL